MKFDTPRQAMEAGIATVFQDLAMIPLPARAVRQYCEELADQGILERRRDRYVLPERATSSADR